MIAKRATKQRHKARWRRKSVRYYIASSKRMAKTPRTMLMTGRPMRNMLTSCSWSRQTRRDSTSLGGRATYKSMSGPFSAVSIAMVKEAISSSCQTSATRLFWLFWLNRSSALGAALCALGRFSHLGAAGIGQVVSCPLSATCWSATDPTFVIPNPL